MKKLLIIVFIIIFLASLIILIFPSLSLNNRNTNSSDLPVNIILLSIDTLRADHMGIYGYDKNTTPNIDEFAKNATVFTNAYTIFPVTPHSFYTFFCNNDVFEKENMRSSQWKVEPSEKLNMLKILKNNGYKSAAFITNVVLGKWFDIFQKSFDEFSYVDLSSKIATASSNPYASIQSVIGPFLVENENSKQITKVGIKWLQDNIDNKFVIWLHYTTPHWPYVPEDKYICKIDKECNLDDYHKVLSKLNIFHEYLKKQPIEFSTPNISKSDLELLKVLYDAEIRSVDDQIKLVLDEIDRLGMKKNSIVIILSDHGESFDHNIYLHHGLTLYNSTTRIPLIIYNPQNEGQKFDSQLIDNSDLLPYLLKLLNIDYQDKNLTEKDDNQGKIIYSLTSVDNSNKFSVIEGDYKYIFSNSDKHLYKGYKDELYNFENDPEEVKNIFSLEQEKATYLKKLLFDKIQQPSIESAEEPKLDQDIIEKLKSIGY